MKMAFIPGGLELNEQRGEYVVTIDGELVFASKNDKAALKKFNTIRKGMEEKYPARELTKEQKLEALKRFVGDSVQRSVRNEQRVSKFGNPKQGRFDNR